MNDKEFLIRVRADIKQALDEMRKLSTESARMADKIEAAGKEGARGGAAINKSNQSALASFNPLLARVGGLVAGYLTLTKVAQKFGETVALAARVETLQVVLDNVGRNAGYGSDQVRALVKEVEALGITTRAAQTIVTRMVQAQLDLGSATQLARVAQDAAVIGNVNSSEALERLLHGIVTLQPEILRTVGITVSLEQEYQKFTAQTGRSIESLSQQERQQVALNAVLREGAKIQGTYVEAMTTADKQAGSLARHVEQLQVAIGQAFTPAYAFLIEEVTREIIGLREEMSELERDQAIQKWARDTADAMGFVLDAAHGISVLVRLVGERIGSLAASASLAVQGEFRAAREALNDYERRVDELLMKQLPSQRLELSRRTAVVGVQGQASKLIFSSEEDKQEFIEQQRLAKDLVADMNRSAREAIAGTTEQTQKLRDAYAETIANLDRQIALLGNESTLEEALWETQNGRFKDLTEAQKQDIVDRAHRLDLMKAELEAQKKLEDQQKKLLGEGKNIFEQTRTPEERLGAEETRLRELLDQGAFGDPESDAALDTYMRARLDAVDRYYDEVAGKTKDTLSEMDRFAIKAAEGMQQAFADDFFNIMQGNFDNLGESFTRLLQRMTAELAASQLLEFLVGDYAKTGKVGGVLGSWFAGEYHSGGVVGAGGAKRNVSPLAFLGAPRLHAGNLGIKRDEYPAILQEGEGVLSRAQMRALGGSGAGAGELRVIVENRGTPQVAREATGALDPEGLVVRIVTDDVQRGGPLSQSLARTFNLRRSGG